MRSPVIAWTPRQGTFPAGDWSATSGWILTLLRAGVRVSTGVSQSARCSEANDSTPGCGCGRRNSLVENQSECKTLLSSSGIADLSYRGCGSANQIGTDRQSGRCYRLLH